MRRIFVGAVVRFDAAGSITPMQIVWKDGRAYGIDRILRAQTTPSLLCGAGYLYLVRIQEQERELGYDGRRWYILSPD